MPRREERWIKEETRGSLVSRITCLVILAGEPSNVQTIIHRCFVAAATLTQRFIFFFFLIFMRTRDWCGWREEENGEFRINMQNITRETFSIKSYRNKVLDPFRATWKAIIVFNFSKIGLRVVLYDIVAIQVQSKYCEWFSRERADDNRAQKSYWINVSTFVYRRVVKSPFPVGGRCGRTVSSRHNSERRLVRSGHHCILDRSQITTSGSK